VGHRAVLDAVVKRKILSSRRESNPRTPIVQPIAKVCSKIEEPRLPSDHISEERSLILLNPTETGMAERLRKIHEGNLSK
jgi:hypothetical protein